MRTAVEQYRSLNDAAAINPIYAPGPVRIWYSKSEFFTDAAFGLANLKRNGKRFPTQPGALPETHTLIGSINAGNRSLSDIYIAMQGEVWSPEGQAFDMIARTGTHTSMSIGDIIERDGKLYMVDFEGFACLSDEVAPE